MSDDKKPKTIVGPLCIYLVVTFIASLLVCANQNDMSFIWACWLYFSLLGILALGVVLSIFGSCTPRASYSPVVLERMRQEKLDAETRQREVEQATSRPSSNYTSQNYRY